MRLPVILIVVNGNLFTLEHVVRAIYSDISVVLVKGTGGAADLIIKCLEDISNIKRYVPVNFGIRMTERLYEDLMKALTHIKQKEWMVSTFDLSNDKYDCLWKKITDGALRAWSCEDTVNKGVNEVFHPNESIFGKSEQQCISQYLIKLDNLSKLELFVGCRLQSAEHTEKIKCNETQNNEDKTKILKEVKQKRAPTTAEKGTEVTEKDVLMTALRTEDTNLLTKSTKNSQTMTDLTDDDVENMYKEELKVEKQKRKKEITIWDIIQNVDPEAYRYLENKHTTKITNFRDAVQSISNKLIRGFCLPISCPLSCSSFRESDGKKYGQEEIRRNYDCLLFAVLLNKKKSAGYCWRKCDNPLLAALMSSRYLEAYAAIAKECFEDSLHQKLQDHSKRFTTRAVNLLDKLFLHNENMATTALDYASHIWFYEESPLHFGHQFQIEEFISHATAQKDASKRLYSYKKGNELDTCDNIHTDTGVDRKKRLTIVEQITRVNDGFKVIYGKQKDRERRQVGDTNTDDKERVSEMVPEYIRQKFGEQSNVSRDQATYSGKLDVNSQDDETPNEHTLKAIVPQGKTPKKLIWGYQFIDFVKHHCEEGKPWKIITAPFSRIVIHTIFFIIALIMFSVLTTNLYPDTRSYLEWIVCVYMFGDLIEEIISMIRPRDGKWSLQRICLHFAKIWNILDVLCIILYGIAFIMHIPGTDELFVHIRRIYSVSLFVMFLRILNILLVFESIGIIIIMMKEMLKDLVHYLIILFILLISAGVVYHANVFPNHTVTAFPREIGNWRIWKILSIPYWQVYGELDLSTLSGTVDNDCTTNSTIWMNDPSVERCPTGDWFTPVIAAFYMMLTNWLLLNIVIAMFSARFKYITEKSTQKWRYHRHSVVIDYQFKVPPPLNIPIRLFSLPYAVRTCCSEDEKKKINDMLQRQREFAYEIIAEERKQELTK